MIQKIKGAVLEISQHSIVIACGDIGFGVHVPRPHVFSIGSVAELFSHLHWSQDNGPTLYGFSSVQERTLFLAIIGCSGVGPKLGLALLASLTPSMLVQAITDNDMSALSSVSGIGAKKAEHLMVYLRHKIDDLLVAIPSAETGQGATHWKDIPQALAALNYSKQEIARAMHYLTESQGGNAKSFDVLLRGALSYLSKSG